MARYGIAEHAAFVQRLAHDARFRWFPDRGNTEGTFGRDMLAKDRRSFDGNHVALRAKSGLSTRDISPSRRRG